jgi:hypothetical protein
MDELKIMYSFLLLHECFCHNIVSSNYIKNLQTITQCNYPSVCQSNGDTDFICNPVASDKKKEHQGRKY